MVIPVILVIHCRSRDTLRCEKDSKGTWQSSPLKIIPSLEHLAHCPCHSAKHLCKPLPRVFGQAVVAAAMSCIDSKSFLFLVILTLVGEDTASHHEPAFLVGGAQQQPHCTFYHTLQRHSGKRNLWPASESGKDAGTCLKWGGGLREGLMVTCLLLQEIFLIYLFILVSVLRQGLTL